MIFVQIVAYRDTEVDFTIRDCMAKAKYPSNVRFGLVYQYMSEDQMPHIPANAQCLRFEPDPEKGVGWMRAAANSMYCGEEFYLQVDAHTRFESDWDVILINQLQTSDRTRPVISTYPPSYFYKDNVIAENNVILGGNNSTMVMTCTGWFPSRLPIIEPHVLINRKQHPSFILAGGFIFTTGDFASNVPYDQSVIFIGEEILLAIQAYTRGYDMLHPSSTPLYHHYTRENCHKPWTDFQERRGVLNYISEKRVQEILQSGGPGYFGIDRTFSDYEEYSGIGFKDCTIKINEVNIAQVSRPRPF